MRRTVRVLGIALALFLVVLLSLPFLVSANQFKPMLESKLADSLGRPVTIGSLGLSVLSGQVTADSLAIADDPAYSQTAFLQAKSMKLGVELWPLIFSRKLNVTGLTIVEPQVALLQSPSGRWNYSSLGGGKSEKAAASTQESSGKSLDLSAKLVRIVDGRFSMGKVSGRQERLELEKVKIEVPEFSASGAFPFSLEAKVVGGGEIKLSGKAGPIDSTDVELTPLTFTLDIARVNLTSLLAGTVPDTSGLGSLQATGNSAGGHLTLTGKLTADKLKLAKSGTAATRQVGFDFATQHDLHKHEGVLQRGNVHIGAAAASITGTYAERGNSTVLDAKFTGTKMPAQELAELLPPLGIALPNGARIESGTATAAFRLQGPSDRLTADGTISLDNARLANFDLGTKMTLIEALAGVKSGPNTEIETLSAKVKYGAEGITVDDLRFIAQGIGELNGAGLISPANALNFKMNATVQTTRSAAVSRTAIPFFVEGTAMNPVFKPDIRGMATTEAKSLLQSEMQKQLKGSAGEASKSLFNSLLGGKKK